MIDNNMRILSLLILLGLVIRLVFILSSPQPLIHGDDIGYHSDAVNFFNGYLFDINQLEDFSRPVIYPFFLYIVYRLFGANPVNGYIAQAFLYVFSAGILYFIARHIFRNNAIGMIAVLCFSLYPPLIWHTGVLYAENLFIAILLSAMLIFLKALERQRTVLYFLSGIALGIGYLCRPVIYYYLFILTGYLYWVFRRNIRTVFYSCAALILGFVIVIIPWVIRNYMVTKTFIPLNHGKGIALLYSNAKLGTSDFLGEPSYEIMNKSRFAQQYQKLAVKEKDLLYYNMARKLIFRHPMQYFLLSLKRFIRLWFNVGYGYKPSVLAMMIAAGNFVVLGLILLAFILFPGDWIRLSLPVILLIGYFTIAHTFTHAVFRYIYPVLPLTFIFLGCSLYRIAKVTVSMIRR